MADYYPLLSRALEALPDRSPALRKAVYDRARNALLGQLRSLDPPVAEADIDLEAKALDAAIERLEADYGGKPSPKPPAEPPPNPTPSATPPSAPSKPLAPPTPKEEPKPAMPAAAAFLPEPPPPPPPAPPKAPAPPPPAAPKAEPAPAPAPAAVPFVPPPRKPKPDAAEPAPAGDAAVPAAEPSPTAVPDDLTNGRKRPRIDVVPPRAGRSRLLRNVFLGAVLVAVIGAIAVAAFFLRDKPANLPQGADTAQTNPSEPQDSKFSDRVGGGDRLQSTRRPPQGSPAAPQPEVTVAQRATLLEENATDPNGPANTAPGRTVWRLEPISGEQGQPLQNAVRATIDLPDPGFSLAMTIRKNLDATLPASHTIELAFTNSGAGGDRVVQDIGLLQLKDEESTRGSPVAGLPVRVRDNLFLIGLSNLPSDVERNTELLTGKNWIDLGLKFKNGKRGVLTFEKGSAGSQVMQTAFDQWRE